MKNIELLSTKIRKNILKITYSSKSAHIASSLSIVDIIATIYSKFLKEIAISSTIWLVFLVKKSFIYVSRVQSPPISKLKSRDPILLRLPKVCAADLHHLYRPKFRYFLSVSFRPLLVFRFFQFVLRWDSAMTVSMAFSHPSWSGRFLGINTMGSSPTFAL